MYGGSHKDVQKNIVEVVSISLHEVQVYNQFEPTELTAVRKNFSYTLYDFRVQFV